MDPLNYSVQRLYEPKLAAELFFKLFEELNFDDTVKSLKRSVSCYGETQNAEFTFGRNTLIAKTFTNSLLKIKKDAENLTGDEYDFVIANLFLDGKNCVGHHVDTFISSKLLLGASRNYFLENCRLCLENGTLLRINNRTNTFWKHRIPPMKDAGPSIVLDFRIKQKCGLVV